MGLLNHVKKRLDSRPNIQLPMTSLMNTLRNSSSSTIIKVQYIVQHKSLIKPSR